MPGGATHCDSWNPPGDELRCPCRARTFVGPFPRALPWAESCTGPSGRRTDEVLVCWGPFLVRRNLVSTQPTFAYRIDTIALSPRRGNAAPSPRQRLGFGDIPKIRPEGAAQLSAPGNAWGPGTPPKKIALKGQRSFGRSSPTPRVVTPRPATHSGSLTSFPQD